MKTIDLTISEQLLNTPICLHSYTNRGYTLYAYAKAESFHSVIKSLVSYEELFIENRDKATGRFCKPYVVNYSGYRIDSSDINSDYGRIEFDDNKGTYEVFPLSDILNHHAPKLAIQVMKRELQKNGEIFWDEDINKAVIKALVDVYELDAWHGLTYLGHNVSEELENNEELGVIHHSDYIEIID